MVGRREFAMLGFAGAAGMVSQLVPEASNTANGQQVHKPAQPAAGVVKLSGSTPLPANWEIAGPADNRCVLQGNFPNKLILAAWRAPDNPLGPINGSAADWLEAGNHYAPDKDAYSDKIIVKFHNGSDTIPAWRDRGNEQIWIHYLYVPTM
jgi:hypothetical protein